EDERRPPAEREVDDDAAEPQATDEEETGQNRPAAERADGRVEPGEAAREPEGEEDRHVDEARHDPEADARGEIVARAAVARRLVGVAELVRRLGTERPQIEQSCDDLEPELEH